MIPIRWIAVDFLLWGVTTVEIVMRVTGLVGMAFSKCLTQTSQQSGLIGKDWRSEAEKDGSGKAGNRVGDLHLQRPASASSDR